MCFSTNKFDKLNHRTLLRFIALLGFCLCLWGCKRNDNTDILGTWKTKNTFHTATYKIFKEKNALVCKVIQYNDGTTQFKNEEKTWYIFNDLIKKDSIYIDGVSGASQSNQRTLYLKPINKDTLEISYTFSEKTIRKEKWIRQTE